MDVLYPMETAFKRRVRNITLYVEFRSMEDMSRIIETVKSMDAQIFEIDLERTRPDGELLPAAVLDIKLARGRASHSEILSSIAELPCVHSIQELIA